MLSGAVRRLASDGWRVSALSRRGAAFAAGLHGSIVGYDCDYHDSTAFSAALDAACAEAGPVMLGLAWFHTLRIAAPRLLAERVGSSAQSGRLFQVLGSAMADPARPDRLETAAAVAADLPACRLRQVVLGFEIEAVGSRWLSHDEISSGVLTAITEDLPFSVIGRTTPWSARPAG